MNDQNGQSSRRNALRMALRVGAGLAPWPRDLWKDQTWWDDLQAVNLVTRPIPISGEVVTAAIPGTAKVEYLTDNLGAARRPMPDAAARRRMAAMVDAS